MNCRLFLLVLILLLCGCSSWKINDVLNSSFDWPSKAAESIKISVESNDFTIKSVAPNVMRNHGFMVTDGRDAGYKVKFETATGGYVGPIPSVLLASTMTLAAYVFPIKDTTYLEVTADVYESDNDSVPIFTTKYVASADGYFSMLNPIPLFIPQTSYASTGRHDPANVKEDLCRLAINHISIDLALVTRRNYLSRKI